MKIGRRDFIVLAGAAAAFPYVAFAQQTTKLRRVIHLSIPLQKQRLDALVQGLADNGYVNGKNISVEFYTAPTNSDLPAFAAKAVATSPDVIFSAGTPASLAAKTATTAIPIVFSNVVDPIGAGLVESFARPGGNVTGVSILSPDTVGKQLSIIKEIVPSLTMLGVLMVPADPATVLAAAPVEAAANALGVQLLFINFVEGQDFAKQYDQVLASGVQATYQPPSTYFSTIDRQVLFDLHIQHEIATMSGSGILDGSAYPIVDVAAYGASQTGTVKDAAALAAAILNGARPSDLPVEFPTTFDFGVNTWMAKKIGITIPQSILAQATLVIDYDIRAPQPGGAK